MVCIATRASDINTVTLSRRPYPYTRLKVDNWSQRLQIERSSHLLSSVFFNISTSFNPCCVVVSVVSPWERSMLSY